MKHIGDMSDYELSRFERRLRHDVDTITPQRQKPSKRRRLQTTREKDQMKTQLDAIAAEWARRTSPDQQATG